MAETKQTAKIQNNNKSWRFNYWRYGLSFLFYIIVLMGIFLTNNNSFTTTKFIIAIIVGLIILLIFELLLQLNIAENIQIKGEKNG